MGPICKCANILISSFHNRKSNIHGRNPQIKSTLRQSAAMLVHNTLQLLMMEWPDNIPVRAGIKGLDAPHAVHHRAVRVNLQQHVRNGDHVGFGLFLVREVDVGEPELLGALARQTDDGRAGLRGVGESGVRPALAEQQRHLVILPKLIAPQ